jgi:hypothetical protein
LIGVYYSFSKILIKKFSYRFFVGAFLNCDLLLLDVSLVFMVFLLYEKDNVLLKKSLLTFSQDFINLFCKETNEPFDKIILIFGFNIIFMK